MPASALVFALFVLAVLHPRPALPQTSTTFFVVNRSSINIIEIYASPASSDNWGRNWIVNNVVRTNEQARIEPGNAAGCVYDVRVVYADKQTEDRRNQNVCQINQMVFAGGGAGGGTAGSGAPGGAAPGNINTTFEVVNGSSEVI